MTMLRRLAVLPILLLVAAVAQAQASAPVDVMTSRLAEIRALPLERAFAAKVECTATGPEVYVNVRLLFTDSLAEFVAHELVHVDQHEQWKGKGCPQLTTEELIDWEIEAYCATRERRMARTRRDKRMTNTELLDSLGQRFGEDLPMAEYLQTRFAERCP